MASFVNYWRIISPPSSKSIYTQQPKINLDDGMNLNSAGYASFATVSWFSNLLKGATARMQRYKQYEAMDTGDVARALDIIAEEISNPDKRTNLPFIIDYQTEDNQDVSDNVATTLRAALRHWAKLQEISTRIYSVCRVMVKYGDCFFRKTSDTKRWEYIDPTRVLGIEINEDGKVVAYHTRPSSFKNTVTSKSSANSDSLEIIPAAGMIHFSLSNEMGDSAPFGLSVLQSAFKDWQKLTMLEDASIIYRITRAPERRVFYIDVGNLPPQRVKQYLEQIKNDIRQKRIPNTANANQTDSQYNPECLALDTLIPLLDGRTVTLQTLIDEYKGGKVNWAYSVNPETGAQAPGVITWAGVTRKNAKRIKLVLDNGKEIIVTPDHKFPIQGRGFVEAQDITPNDSLFPFITRKMEIPGTSSYEQVWDTCSKSWKWTHRVVSEFMGEREAHAIFSREKQVNLNEAVVHHLDYNRFNNSPSNLVCVGGVEVSEERAEPPAPEWEKLKEIAENHNHKVVTIEEVEDADVGTITIDGRETLHNYHTFALAAGVFTKNSMQEDFFFGITPSGRGSRVETLPAGANWEIPELDYFLNKVFRALRVPTSYMKGQEAQGAQVQDGKVGIAYIEELRFANYIIRLQQVISSVFDDQFKNYLKTTGVTIDPELFNLVLPEPQNFAIYRTAALDADLINSFNSVEGVKYLSKRFILKRYLGLTDDEIQMNEVMLKQEKKISDTPTVDELQQMYDPAAYESRPEVTVPEIMPPGGEIAPGETEPGAIGAAPGPAVAGAPSETPPQ